MTRSGVVIISLLGVVGLLFVVLAVSWTSGHDPAYMNPRANDYMAMMDAMGRMDSDEMLERMRSVLGEDGYSEMLAHAADHRNGMASQPGGSIDGLMHMMMDGMMNQMPPDRDQIMPMMPR